MNFKDLKKFQNYSQFFKINFNKKNFCFKYIPSGILKFEDIQYNEKACTIYKLKTEIVNREKTKETFNKYISGCILLSMPLYSMFSERITLINPSQYFYPVFFGNVFVFSLLLKNYFLYKKNHSMIIKSLYLLKNGFEVLIITINGSFHVIKIQDFKPFDRSQEGIINIGTEEREFILLEKDSQILNDEILDALDNKKLINTFKSYKMYNRLTIPK
jgi:hypothetical protein